MNACASRLDHITVTAPSLEAGAEFVRQRLGVDAQPGGEHVRMGTHNLLLRLGESLFLEVLAINPEAAPPGRPRWFGLDRLPPSALPALSTWVARTPDIHATAGASSEALGTVEPMRRGVLEWLITLPADGVVPLDGIAPALIQWPAGVHPATTLQDFGLSLVRLEIFHADPQRVVRLLGSIGLEAPLSVSAPSGEGAAHLVAHIMTPRGLRLLAPPDPHPMR